ncbi:MAG: carbon storage regulator [Thermoguttaceae bacterium]|nr:carbon storage regulator [Thermoguttaceae bacterium]
MLVVSRRNGESVYVGDAVKITVVEIKGSRIRLGVEADRDTFILRAEKKVSEDDDKKVRRAAEKARKAA